MGWCSGTVVFDAVMDAVLKPETDRAVMLRTLIDALEDMDWDCQQDSEYWEHPIVRQVMQEKHPDWFRDN